MEKGYSLDMVVYDLKCNGFAINKSSLSRYENGKMPPTVNIAVELGDSSMTSHCSCLILPESR